VAARRAAASALAAIAAHRFCFGLSTITALLLYRNFFAEASDVEAGLAGLARAFAAAGAGFVTAGVLTPPAARRTGTSEWIVVCLLTAAATEAVFVAALTPDSVVIGSFVLGLTAQSMKICVDTLVQEHVDDEFRGRVFSMYDVLFNVAFVSAAAVAAFAVPTSGRSAALYAVIAGGYAATALAYARAARVGRPPRAVRRTTA
jgi:MFS family permease